MSKVNRLEECGLTDIERIQAEGFFIEALYKKGIHWILTYDAKEEYKILLLLWFNEWECQKTNFSCLNACMQSCWKQFVYLLTGEKGTKIKD